ncbi:hypothetical protein [Flagellimonas flava]|uniref:Cytochrome c domain-containing protein n=1 Tax=Flagellimonas flava TaxID=570519 RepID=A0A1M5K117_9FLAO|nr:hypothetical protein [Allomuricauda flava]SHG46355.1 hypothetical protein SAMN04488116_1323 [Allomuricauda flava]
MKKSLIYFLTMTFMVVVASCSSDSEEDLVPTDDDPTNGTVTYEDNISSLIGGSCLGCHSSPPTNGAPFSLTTFSDVESRASGILTAISRQTGEPRAMPPGGRLPQSTIDLVDAWIDQGTPEN